MLAENSWERYLLALKGLKPASFKKYREHIVYFEEWFEGKYNKQIEYCTQDQIIEYMDYLYKNNNNNNTRKLKLISINSYLDFLVFRGILDKSPAAMIPSPRVREKRIANLSQGEVYSFFRQVDINKRMGLRDVCLFIFTFFGGFRRGEINNLNIEDVVPNSKDCVDVDVRGKFDSFRRVDFWRAPSVFLLQWQQLRIAEGASPDDPFITSSKDKSKRLTGGNINDAFIRYAGRAKINRSKINHHMGRATHISDLRQIQGYDLFAIQGRVGHKNADTTQRYLSYTGVIKKEYPSLAAYWSKFTHIWDQKEEV